MTTPITPQDRYVAQFADVVHILNAACSTDEPHEYCGDSDRLLRAASICAQCAVTEPVSTKDDAESAAYDVAACIKAARLVPGDTESLERTALLVGAAHILGAIVEEDPADVIKPYAARLPLKRPYAST